jgi:hypothetical protein
MLRAFSTRQSAPLRKEQSDGPRLHWPHGRILRRLVGFHRGVRAPVLGGIA